MHKKISADERWVSAFAPQLDILVWAVRDGSVAASSRLAQEIFAAAAGEDLHLALVKYRADFSRLVHGLTKPVTSLACVLC